MLLLSKVHHKCLKLLLDAGARVDSRRYRPTPLSSAVKRGHEECVKLLMKAGGEKWGTTALLFEAKQGEIENICFLLRLGVAIDNTVVLAHGKKETLELMFAAGQMVEEDDFSLFALRFQMCLMNHCREVIREHLLQISTVNLLSGCHNLDFLLCCRNTCCTIYH